MLPPFAIVAFGISLVWLIVLSFLFWQLYSHYNRLTKGITTKSLKTILEEMLEAQSVSSKDIAYLKSRCDTIEKDGLLHIQKVGLLRFNPFKDTGGDQSFILSFLDREDSGVVISGLYSRSGTRWYAKRVVNGKGIEHDLSDEERKAVKEAK